jgi:hypothetical protein
MSAQRRLIRLELLLLLLMLLLLHVQGSRAACLCITWRLLHKRVPTCSMRCTATASSWLGRPRPRPSANSRTTAALPAAGSAAATISTAAAS